MFEITEEFLSTPLAELECYGLPPKVVTILEYKCGKVWVRDLVGVTPEWLMGCENMGVVSIRQLQDALRKLVLALRKLGE